jgi:hypothetical protein
MDPKQLVKQMLMHRWLWQGIEGDNNQAAALRKTSLLNSNFWR